MKKKLLIILFLLLLLLSKPYAAINYSAELNESRYAYSYAYT